MSWIIPVRDGTAWIRDAVASALADSGDTDEVLVIDDGSTVPVATHLEPDPRLRVLRTDRNGIVRALEWGRHHARGRYLARLDADDVTLPGRIEAQIDRLESDPRLAVVGGGAELFSEAGASPGQGMLEYVAWINGLMHPELGLFVDAPLFHPAVLMRADSIQAVGGYRDGDFPEDYDLWLRLWSGGYGLAAVPTKVVRIRDHGERLTRRDPRYRREAFEDLKRITLSNSLLRSPKRVAVWCGPRFGKPWIRWLKSRGHEVVVAIDLHAGGSRVGVPVIAPDELKTTDCDLLLVAVGRRGARELIRDSIRQIRPEWVEGMNWWAVR